DDVEELAARIDAQSAGRALLERVAGFPELERVALELTDVMGWPVTLGHSRDHAGPDARLSGRLWYLQPSRAPTVRVGGCSILGSGAEGSRGPSSWPYAVYLDCSAH